MKRAAFASCAVALSLASPLARGNAAARVWENPENTAGAVVLGKTQLVVEKEELSFRCEAPSGEERDPPCAFEATYHVLNPSQDAEEIVGLFFGIAASDVIARADGKDANAEIDRAVQEKFIQSLRQEDPETFERMRRVSTTGFRLAVAAGARKTLVFTGTMSPVYGENGHAYSGFAIPASVVRHVKLSDRARDKAHRSYAYAVSPIRSWAGSPMVDVTVSVPSSQTFAPGEGGWTIASSDGRTIARRRIDPRAVSILRFGFDDPGTGFILNGGPLLALGARTDALEPRGRVGYEVAFSGTFLASAVIESDFAKRFTFAPLVDAALPNLFLLVPSLGAGLGVPVQLHTGDPLRVGARLQLIAAWPILSVVVPIDYFPTAPSGAQWQTAIMGQVSF